MSSRQGLCFDVFRISFLAREHFSKAKVKPATCHLFRKCALIALYRRLSRENKLLFSL